MSAETGWVSHSRKDTNLARIKWEQPYLPAWKARTLVGFQDTTLKSEYGMEMLVKIVGAFICGLWRIFDDAARKYGIDDTLIK